MSSEGNKVLDARFGPDGSRTTFESLPSEIVAHALVLGCPTLSRFDPMAVRKHQVLVTSVCSEWRDLMHQTPALWTSILIQHPADSKQCAMSDQMLDIVLRRAGVLDLNLLVLITAPPRTLTFRSLTSLVLILPRVRALTVHVVKTDPSEHQLFSIRNAPRLREVWLSGVIGLSHISLLSTNKTFALESFDYADSTAPLNLANIPSTHLKSFSSSAHARRADYEPFFARCEHLETLSLKRAYRDIAKLVLPPSLRSIELQFYYHLPALCSFILSPFITHLTIQTQGSPSASGIPTAHTAPELSSLRTLSLRTHPLDTSELKDFLDRAPELTALETMGLGFAPIFALLTEQGGARYPGLRFLRILCEPSHGISLNDCKLWSGMLLQDRGGVLRVEWNIRKTQLGLGRAVEDGSIEAPSGAVIRLLPDDDEPFPPLSVLFNSGGSG